MAKRIARALILALLAGGILAGCHASEDDPAGLAGELEDPVRREHAIANIQRLYSQALSASKGDRNAPEVTAVVDATVEKLSAAYLAHREDTQNGTYIMRLLADMRDPRSLPALIGALEWRSEVNEEHAVAAAETLQHIAIPADKLGAVITALSDALARVTGARGKDAQMRNAFINTLGQIGDARAIPALTKVMLSEDYAQNFLFNRLAGEKLAAIADESTVPSFITALYLFAGENPGMRMNDVAADALTRIGRPAVAPLVAVLKGQNEEINKLVKRYIEAVARKDKDAAAKMSREMLVNAEATYTLGSLGYSDAFDPILAETASSDYARRMNAVIALVRLQMNAAQLDKARATLVEIYNAAPGPLERAQLLAVMRHRYDPTFLATFLSVMKDVDAQPPEVRLAAAEAYALLANRKEAAELSSYLRTVSEDKDPYRDEFEKRLKPYLDAASECDADAACWAKKAGSQADKDVLRKAAYMLGRTGGGNAAALAALVGLFGHTAIEVRLAAVAAVDHLATGGSSEAVAKIDALAKEEAGRKIWKDFAREALPTQSRLRHRAEK